MTFWLCLSINSSFVETCLRSLCINDCRSSEKDRLSWLTDRCESLREVRIWSSSNNLLLIEIVSLYCDRDFRPSSKIGMMWLILELVLLLGRYSLLDKWLTERLTGRKSAESLEFDRLTGRMSADNFETDRLRGLACSRFKFDLISFADFWGVAEVSRWISTETVSSLGVGDCWLEWPKM